MQKLMNEKIIPKIMAFVNLKGIQAIKDGMVYSMPLLIVGSVFFNYYKLPDSGSRRYIGTNGNQSCARTGKWSYIQYQCYDCSTWYFVQLYQIGRAGAFKWCNRSPWSIYYDDTCFHYHRKWRYSRGDHQ